MGNSAGGERTGDLLSVLRAARLLELVAEVGEVGTSELARRLGWTKTTVHRLATTLKSVGYLEQSPETARFRLGLRLFELGSLVVPQRELRNVAAPIMEGLVETTRETSHLGVLDEALVEVVYVHKVESPQAVRLYTEIGAHHPAYCASTGKVLLAFQPRPRLERLLEGLSLRPFTPRTITDRAVLLAHLEEVRRQGFSISNGEYREGVCSVAAPVFNHAGEVVAGINIGAPVSRMTVAKARALAPRVRQAAAEVSARLGFRGQAASLPGTVAGTVGAGRRRG